MLEARTHQDGVRRSEAIVPVATERSRAVDIGSAQGRLKVKRYHMIRGHERLVHHEPNIEASLQISRRAAGRGWAIVHIETSGAVIRSVGIEGDQRSGFSVKRDLMREIECEAIEREFGGAG